MKPVLIIVVISFSMLGSCYKPYDAGLDENKKILVVNGLITNENASYRVHLSYALPFDSIGTSQPAYASNVHVTDELGNYYAFYELGNGYYASDSLQFTGNPGSTYTLYINTDDGERYESDPQRLYPIAYPDRVYAEFDYQETLSKISGLLELTHGANIFIDIKNQVDTLPRFRFTTNLVTQYVSAGPSYCWQTENANPNIDLTGRDYPTNSASVNKHAICFIDDYLIRWVSDKTVMVANRIIYLNQYTLNNEAYLYYNNIDELLRSNGKLFDPIATQLVGNIKCITAPDKKVFGFFEAASVTHSCYKVDFRNLINDQPSITKRPYILPPKSNGCSINIIPPFWGD
jgi:hypothetical protein